jgi:uncharacterized protein (DUF2237 family)
MKTVFAFLLLTAAVVAIPEDGVPMPDADQVVPEADGVVPETDLVSDSAMVSTMADEEAHEEARAHVQELMKAGKTESGCKKLAEAAIADVKDDISTAQKSIGKMDFGKDCDQAGLAAYEAAKQLEAKAKKKSESTAQSLSKTLSTRLKITVPLDTLANGQCDSAKNTAAYKDGKAAAASAQKAHEKAKGEYSSAKKATADALKAHEKDKKWCACHAQWTHKEAIKIADKVNGSANAKSWTKGHHMECVLAGTTPAKCKVPTMPTASVPKMPSWVAKTICGTYAKNSYVKNANKGGWGGSCTCPDGSVYQVGDNLNSCGSLACFGGKSGTCHRKNGPWSKAKVTCGKLVKAFTPTAAPTKAPTKAPTAAPTKAPTPPLSAWDYPGSNVKQCSKTAVLDHSKTDCCTKNSIAAKKNPKYPWSSWDSGCFMKAQIPATRTQDYKLQMRWIPGSRLGNAMFGLEESPHAKFSYDYTAGNYNKFAFAVYCGNKPPKSPLQGVERNGRGGRDGWGPVHVNQCYCGDIAADIHIIMKVDGTVLYQMYGRTCRTAKLKAKNVAYVVDSSIYESASVTQKLYVGSFARSVWSPAP